VTTKVVTFFHMLAMEELVIVMTIPYLTVDIGVRS
jgi:hypothetical protein